MSKKKDPRNIFLSLVPADAKKILDVGCAAGGLSSKIKNRSKNIELIGIEQDKKLCQKAEKVLDKVHLANIEEFEVPYPEGYFDCIIFVDILEHLINPVDILTKYKRCLSDNGCIVISMPNVRYYKVILRLIFGGTWDYMEEGGLLDKTHLRFFTLINTKELIEAAGYKIIDIKRNKVSSRGFRILNYLCFNGLRDFLTYQYFIKAKKAKNPKFSKRKKYRF